MFVVKNRLVINLNNVSNFFKSNDNLSKKYFIKFEFNKITIDGDYVYESFNFESEQERDEAFKSILSFINKESNLLQI